jgi:hypothetical protein
VKEENLNLQNKLELINKENTLNINGENENLQNELKQKKEFIEKYDSARYDTSEDEQVF